MGESAEEDNPGTDDVEDETEVFEATVHRELEIMAADLEEMELNGADPQMLDDLELASERFLETFVAMKEAKRKLAAVRKDRNYKGPAKSSGKGGAKKFPTPADRKAVSTCHDCGERGHWAGDAGCKRPGAGLFQPARGKGYGKAAETMSVIHEGSHEVATTVLDALGASSATRSPPSRSEPQAATFSQAGALDSACNRSVAGHLWLSGYLKALVAVGLRDLATSIPELEHFRFGNGGRLASEHRWRLPMAVSGVPVFVWVSVVLCDSLGLLLGKDFLGAIGAKLDFEKSTLDSQTMGISQLALQELRAGHFRLDVLPSRWPTSGSWHRCGLAGAVELYTPPRSQALRSGSPKMARGSRLLQALIVGAALTAKAVETSLLPPSSLLPSTVPFGHSGGQETASRVEGNAVSVVGQCGTPSWSVPDLSTVKPGLRVLFRDGALRQLRMAKACGLPPSSVRSALEAVAMDDATVDLSVRREGGEPVLIAEPLDVNGAIAAEAWRQGFPVGRPSPGPTRELRQQLADECPFCFVCEVSPIFTPRLLRQIGTLADEQIMAGRRFFLFGPPKKKVWARLDRRFPPMSVSVRTSRPSGHRNREMWFCTSCDQVRELLQRPLCTAALLDGRMPGGVARVVIKGLLAARRLHDAFPAEAGDDEVDADHPDFGGIGEDDSEDQADEPAGPAPEPHLTASVRRLHENTGHRPKRQLVRALVIAGAPAETIRAAKLLKRPVCEEVQQTKPKRPATLPRARHFGDVVHIDLFQVEAITGSKHWALNVVDAASKFQVCAIVPRKTTAAVTEAMDQCWMTWAGPPSTIVADMGPEFVSEEFGAYCEGMGIHLHNVAVEAPHQNGIAERAGGAVKVVFRAICREHAASTPAEVQRALVAAVHARNADINDSGFSPQQWVLGRAARIPADLLGRPVGARLAEHAAAEAVPEFHQRVAMLETARRALTRLHFSRRLRKAELARPRTVPESQDLAIGDLAYFYREQMRNPKGAQRKGKLLLRRWHGPAIVLGHEGRSAIYLGYRGNVTKSAPEHVRPASSLEQLSAEGWAAALDEILEQAPHPQPPAEDVPPPPPPSESVPPGPEPVPADIPPLLPALPSLADPILAIQAPAGADPPADLVDLSGSPDAPLGELPSATHRSTWSSHGSGSSRFPA